MGVELGNKSNSHCVQTLRRLALVYDHSGVNCVAARSTLDRTSEANRRIILRNNSRRRQLCVPRNLQPVLKRTRRVSDTLAVRPRLQRHIGVWPLQATPQQVETNARRYLRQYRRRMTNAKSPAPSSIRVEGSGTALANTVVFAKSNPTESTTALNSSKSNRPGNNIGAEVGPVYSCVLIKPVPNPSEQVATVMPPKQNLKPTRRFRH